MQEAKHVNRRKKEEAKRAKELEEEQNDMIAEEEAANPKKKAVTAIKVAKKLIKKKLKVNTKMVFDEEGEVSTGPQNMCNAKPCMTHFDKLILCHGKHIIYCIWVDGLLWSLHGFTIFWGETRPESYKYE